MKLSEHSFPHTDIFFFARRGFLSPFISLFLLPSATHTKQNLKYDERRKKPRDCRKRPPLQQPNRGVTLQKPDSEKRVEENVEFHKFSMTVPLPPLSAGIFPPLTRRDAQRGRERSNKTLMKLWKCTEGGDGERSSVTGVLNFSLFTGKREKRASPF